MTNKIIRKTIGFIAIAVTFSACVPAVKLKKENNTVPERFSDSKDTTNTATVKWKEFFTDPNLVALIDTALKNNQELNIILQEINIAKNEIQASKGEYLPYVNLQAGAGLDKVGRYTREGALEATTDIKPGEEFPEPFSDLMLGAHVSWEVDIWKKLRNAKTAAVHRYLSSVEGKNFMITNLVAEIANSYYELMALDSQHNIVKKNIEIQKNALKIVKLQKKTAKATELAVKKFEAEVLKNQSRQYEIQQMIKVIENRINFLVGRFPQAVQRSSLNFMDLAPDTVYAGIPAQLLQNRPDIQQAEQELTAAKLDVRVAKANFYPTLDISAGIGYQAFNPAFLLQTPESMLYSLAGDLIAPLINRKAIKVEYLNANAKQLQAVYNYERSILTAYTEVANLLSNISNLQQSYDLKSKQVAALTESISIANRLFRSARADYMEVLMTQRDALEARMELIETQQQQLNAMVNIYQALGGGWR